MANTIKHKRGSGSNPTASDLVAGELAIRTDTGVVFTKKDDGTVVEVSGSGETNLGVSTTTTAVTVTSDTGNNATISEASGSAAGVMSTAHHDKLDGIESNATADQSAAEILTAIKTVDGSGTGLDADLLDGIEATGFLRSDQEDAKTAGHLIFSDNIKARFGTGSDFDVYHDGTHGNIENTTGDLYIQGQADDVIIRAADDISIQPQNGENGIKVIGNGEVELFYDNVKKFDTKSDGCEVIGELECDSLDVDGAANITGNVDINGDIRHNGDTNCLFGFPANDTFRVSTGGTERFRITSTGAIAIEGSSNYGSSGQVLTSNGNDAPTWQNAGGTVASDCIYENSQTISSNYSITSGKNAMSAGPITIASGVTVTVTSGSTYTIV